MNRLEAASIGAVCSMEREKSDPFSSLPPELFVFIVDAAPSAAVKMRSVCRSWRDMFGNESPAEPSFRAAVRSRYGVTKCPRWARNHRISWGHIYLTLSKESCHTCCGADIFYGAYASLAAFAGLLPTMTLMLFPVCRGCVLRKSNDASMPIVLELDCVSEIFEHISANDVQAERENLKSDKGMLYKSPRWSPQAKKDPRYRKKNASGEIEVVYVSDILSRWAIPENV